MRTLIPILALVAVGCTETKTIGAAGDAVAQPDLARPDLSVDAQGDQLAPVDAGSDTLLAPPCSTTWTTLSTSGLQSTFLQGIWGSGPTDLFTVGGFGPQILRFDGASWSAMPSPLGGPACCHRTYRTARAVWGSSPGDVYVGGGEPACKTCGVGDGYVLHYDGTSWSEVDAVSFPPIYGLWGSGPTDVFAVGAQGNGTSYQGAIRHYDGTMWAEQSSGTTQGNTSGGLRAVWGSGPSDVFAVGDGGTILRFNGGSWINMASGTSRTFRAVWGSGPTDVFAVGDGGTILHYDGTRWSQMSSGIGFSCVAVWGSAPTDVWIVAADPMDLVPQTEELRAILHFDGKQWTTTCSGNGEPAQYAIWGSGPKDVYTVGGAVLHLGP